MSSVVAKEVCLETGQYGERWFLLMLFCILHICCVFFHANFGQVSDVYSEYFDVDPVKIDLLTVSIMLGVLIASPWLASAVSAGTLGLRTSVIGACICLIIAYMILVAASFDSNLFYLVMCGQILNGISLPTLNSIPPTFAALWFTDSQVGTAIAINMIGKQFGTVLGYVVPTSVLIPPAGNMSATAKADWMAKTSANIRLIYIPFVGVLLIVLLILIKHMRDLPLKPPTQAQAAKRLKTEQNAFKPSPKLLFRNFFFKTKELFTNRSFMLDSILFGLIYHSDLILIVMLGDIIRTLGESVQLSIESNRLSGFMMATSSIGSIVGSFAAGKFMDRFKMYSSQASVGIFFIFASSLFTLVGFHFENIVSMFIGQALCGFNVMVAVTALVELVTQHTYPANELFVTLWLTFVQEPFVLVHPVFGRLFYFWCGDLYVFMYRTVILFVGFLLSLGIDSNYKRLQFEKTKIKNHQLDERTAIDLLPLNCP